VFWFNAARLNTRHGYGSTTLTEDRGPQNVDFSTVMDGRPWFCSVQVVMRFCCSEPGARSRQDRGRRSGESNDPATAVACGTPELQKTRGIERQELRFKSYAGLWKQLRPLAIYDPTAINRKAMGDLSLKLSDWYFSEDGGLLLTPQARDFYFALQDLLRATSRSPEDWEADRSEESEDTLKRTIRDLLAATKSDGALSALDYISARAFQDWEDQAAGLGGKWRAESMASLPSGYSWMEAALRDDTASRVCCERASAPISEPGR
jgi:hypothetical protein